MYSSKEIDQLAIKYSENKDVKLGQLIISAFEPYFQKYVGLLRGYSRDPSNPDTVKFFRLFTKDVNNNKKLGVTDSQSVLYVLKTAFQAYTKEDLYHEVMAIFIEALSQYKPIIKYDKKNYISFTHFVQTRVRYRLFARVYKISKDALTTNPLEYRDITPSPDINVSEDIDLTPSWVSGEDCGVFKVLTEYERYLIYLKFGEKKTFQSISNTCGCAFNTVKAKFKEIKEKLRIVRVNY